MNLISALDLPKLIDISAVRTNVTEQEVKEVAKIANKYGFICAFAMPCYTELLKKELGSDTKVHLGGVVGFPSGADTTSAKILTAKEMISLGCDEVDMVINVGALLSGDYDFVKNEISEIKKIVSPIPLKSILEISYLDEEKIKIGTELAVEAGVDFVKTGTGWAKNPTTVETIKIINEVVNNRCSIKAAGGVRSLKTLEDMYVQGCRRFGISLNSALSILREAYEREGLEFNS